MQAETTSTNNVEEQEDENKIAHLSLTERLEQGVEGYTKKTAVRPRVRWHLVRAYELHMAALVLHEMMTEERAQTNILVKSALQREYDKMMKEKSSILQVSEELLADTFERRLLQLVKYRCKYSDAKNEQFITHDAKLNQWWGNQRRRRIFKMRAKATENNTTLSALEQDFIALFERLDLSTEAQKFLSFDERLELLREYKKKHGNIKVPQVYKEGHGLGEWIHRLRREYDDFQEGKKVPKLTSERIAELDAMGMIWKIRYGRPKKGDERFRLRRKSEKFTKKNQTKAEGQAKVGDTSVEQQEATIVSQVADKDR